MPADQWLRVDPTRCTGVGLCAHLAGEVIRLDSWGFPIIDSDPARPVSRRRLLRAVRGCPQAALFLDGSAREPGRRR